MSFTETVSNHVNLFCIVVLFLFNGPNLCVDRSLNWLSIFIQYLFNTGYFFMTSYIVLTFSQQLKKLLFDAVKNFSDNSERGQNWL